MSKKTILQKIEKKAKQHIYKWHRFFAYITFIPVVLWCLSGIMHPFMAHFFKPEIKNEFITPKPVNFSQVNFSLQQVLAKEHMQTFKNFRYVEMKNQWFYQIKKVDNTLAYYNVTTGAELKNGDMIYAHYLARFFLDDAQSAILKTDYLTQFDNQYKYVNRYLPVYKVCFDRNDKMQVYVETASSKLATFNPLSRQVFIWFFDTFHNWSFLDAIATPEIRIVVMIGLLGSIILSALSGVFIYGFFWKVFRKSRINSANKTRLQHRKLGLWFSVLSIGFAFSGALHLTKKWNPKPIQDMVYQPILEADKLKVASNKLDVNEVDFQNASLIQWQDTLFYRCELKPVLQPEKVIDAKENKWKKNSAPTADVVYINATTNKVAKDLEFKYATFIAQYFDGVVNTGASCCEGEGTSSTTCSIKKASLKETAIVTEFDSREYGFVNKRLPVVKLAYATPENTTYFVETATSRIASVVGKSDRVEGYSFAIFHKFLWMDWAGKPIRDFVMTCSAIALFILAILGLRLLFKR
ncbi:PepSY domain-containing protein [Flavobacterium sp.]|uniref:PepSY domain-containing protein n=1 Tax=Flavobacterium sp. TaxID=239 RepID=UPI003D1394C7